MITILQTGGLSIKRCTQTRFKRIIFVFVIPKYRIRHDAGITLKPRHLQCFLQLLTSTVSPFQGPIPIPASYRHQQRRDLSTSAVLRWKLQKAVLSREADFFAPSHHITSHTARTERRERENSRMPSLLHACGSAISNHRVVQ
jgi:hypothetical protein